MTKHFLRKVGNLISLGYLFEFLRQNSVLYIFKKCQQFSEKKIEDLEECVTIDIFDGSINS